MEGSHAHALLVTCLTTSSRFVRCRALLPQYRQAPDYDTALKQIYSSGVGAQPAAEPPTAYMYRSQPEIRLTEAADVSGARGGVWGMVLRHGTGRG